MAGEKRVRITETGLRDAHQSLIATRMRTDDMLPSRLLGTGNVGRRNLRLGNEIPR